MAFSNSEIEELLRLLRAAGVRLPFVQGVSELRRLLQSITSGRSLSADARQLLNVLQTLEREAGRAPLPPATPPATNSIGGNQPPKFPGRLTGPAEPRGFGSATRTRSPQGFPEEHQLFSDEFLSPTSSNVYSFQYFRRPGDTLGILYVTFKGNRIRGEMGPPVFKGGKRQIHGQPGRTVGEKINKPGSTYAYFNVGADVFNRMKAAFSKGTFVWDELRVRGTVYGHQYPYQLISGQVLKVGGGRLAQYIPRRATSQGFRTRSLADTGTRRRGFVSSTLPPSVGGGGFTTRRQ